MTGTNLYVNKCKQSRSYLKHLVISLKLDGSYMFRSTTIIRELAIEPGQRYIDIKTFGKATS